MTARTNVRRSMNAVADLPHNVVINIVGHMATSSPHPMANLCSLRAMASKEGVVGRCVALEREEAMKWLDNERYLAVVNHLAGAGNPEACIIIGLLLVFAHQDMKRGLVCLEQVADACHKAMDYVLGLFLYTAGEVNDVGKHYISPVEGEPADDGCEMAKRTNWECKRCQRLTANVVQAEAWKMVGPLGQVWALLEDGHRCTRTGYGVTEGWDDYVVFCSDDCRIGYEYAKFFAQVLNYLA